MSQSSIFNFKFSKNKGLASLFVLSSLTFLLTFMVGYLLVNNQVSAQACQQQADPSKARSDGLISVPSAIVGTFNNASGTCVVDNLAGIPNFDLYTYNDMRSIFYDKVRPTSTKDISKPAVIVRTPAATDSDIKSAGGKDTLLYVQGNLNMNNNPVGSVKTLVVFVEGDLNINKNITYGSNDAGIVFVVKNNININKDVTQVNAILVSEGIICTNYDPSVSQCTKTPGGSQLVVNGNLINLNNSTGKNILFYRDLGTGNDNTPAEKINLEAKYFAILAQIFSQDLRITTEDTNYSINL